MSAPTIRVHRPDGIQGIEKMIALRAVESYCNHHGLSVEKLKHQIYDVYGDVAVFSAPSNVQPDGLRNDLASRPIPILIMENSGKGLIIRQTEHTVEYLNRS